MTDNREEKSYTISELAEEFDISTRSIRFYEEKSLISPGRTKGNHRVYTERDRIRLKKILRGKRFGYSLEEIAEIIGLTDIDLDEADQIRKSLTYGTQKLKDIRERINDLKLLEEDFIAMGEKLASRLAKLSQSDSDPA
ncbi:MAG: MerR family transcriptional regulator [Thermodesulfobacteriota bacterium]